MRSSTNFLRYRLFASEIADFSQSPAWLWRTRAKLSCRGRTTTTFLRKQVLRRFDSNDWVRLDWVGAHTRNAGPLLGCRSAAGTTNVNYSLSCFRHEVKSIIATFLCRARRNWKKIQYPVLIFCSFQTTTKETCLVCPVFSVSLNKLQLHSSSSSSSSSSSCSGGNPRHCWGICFALPLEGTLLCSDPGLPSDIFSCRCLFFDLHKVECLIPFFFIRQSVLCSFK